MSTYAEIKRQLARGWNTWNTRSVLSHVLLPEGFALNLGIKEYRGGEYLKEALIGRKQEIESSGLQDHRVETVYPGQHTYDGSYTELTIEWRDIEMRVQTAATPDDLVMLVMPIKNQQRPCTLVVEPGILWNRAGHVTRDRDTLVGVLPDKEIPVFLTNDTCHDPYVTLQTPYLAVTLDQELGISTGKKRALVEIKQLISEKQAESGRRKTKYGELSEMYDALQASLAWDTVYDPQKDRVVTPVSRLWNINYWGGYVLYCWDTYFAAFMASIDNRELAYANAIEITRERVAEGFVPGCNAANGFKTHDRSQPPVGSMIVKALYERFGENWLLEELFGDLYAWNTWYLSNRQVEPGLLAWGTKPYEPVIDNYWERAGIGDRYGAAMESGLDNSPMYDDVPVDRKTNMMPLADVGLTSLYIADCEALAEIASIIGRISEAQILRQRAERCGAGLQTLWHENAGIFLNKRTDTGSFSERLSPANFYPLLTDYVTAEQANRMLKDHFYNPREFWGDWILPSISRDDPAYPDQDYWRGRIWAPMNFLVYLGLRKHKLEQACRDLAEKSQLLLLKEWQEHRHVHENYCADTGEGCNKENSDAFYHWGALLSVIALMETGYMA